MTDKDCPSTFGNAKDALDWLSKHWPKPSGKAKHAFHEISKAFETLPTSGLKDSNMMDLMQRALLASDSKLLGREISYRLLADQNLPQVLVDQENILQSLMDMIDYLISMTPRGSKFLVSLNSFELRGDVGVKATLSAQDPGMNRLDEYSIVTEAFLSPEKSPLARCRHTISNYGGQLWMEVPKENTVEISFVIPSKSPSRTSIASEAFRYDIDFTNYPSIRKRFGKKKALYLLREVERYVKSIVRYPFDIVVISQEKGIVTVIYETMPHSSRSVTSRISQKLGSENFHIGKIPVVIDFKYTLARISKDK